jgi:uncharacterized protein (TIGR02246 family)
MKHKFLCLLLALGVAVSSAQAQMHRIRKPPAAPPAQGTQHSDDMALIDLEKEFFAAIRQKDNDKLNGLLADDFAYITPGQPEMTRVQFLKHVQGLPDTIEWLGADDMRVKILGPVAVVTGVRNTKTRFENGTLVSSDASFADIFRKNGDEWELELVHEVGLPAPANSPSGK